jgi:hypothetical protein
MKNTPNILEDPFSIPNSSFKTDQLGVILELGLKEFPLVVQKVILDPKETLGIASQELHYQRKR